jgi:putative hemolysin
MSDVNPVYYVIFAVCLLLAAFFCSAETAFIGTQKLRLQHMVRTGDGRASRIARMLQKPELFLSTVLLGINLFETAVAAVGTIISVSLWGQDLGALLATIIVTIVTLVIAELVPKSLAARHPETLALTYAAPLRAFSLVLYPVIFVLSHIGIRLTRLVNDDAEVKPTLSEAEFHTAIEIGEAEGVVDEREAEMLHAVFDFGDRKASEVMVPRPEIIFVEKGTSLAQFFATYAQSPRSRYPVYQGNRDNVVGLLSIKDVLMGLAKGTIDQNSTIDTLVRLPFFTPENKLASALFAEMLERNIHMAIVVDEYGGVVGVVGLDEITSSIVGPITAEFEPIEKEYVAIDENTFQIDGGMRIEDINEQLGLGLPEDGYETMAGFVLHVISRVPRQGEQFKYKNLKMVVTKMQGARITEVLVTKEVRKTDLTVADRDGAA